MRSSATFRAAFFGALIGFIAGCFEPLVRVAEDAGIGEDAGVVEDAGTAMMVTCDTGLLNCRNVCVNPKTSNANCGACGSACAAGEACAGGACFPTDCPSTDCSADQVCISESCRDRLCEAVTCPSGATCYLGMCRPRPCGALTCPSGQFCLEGRCVDARCLGVTCPAGQQCQAGQCVTGCTPGGMCTPAEACQRGTVTCPSAACAAAGPVPAGASCAAGVCDGDGGCVACDAGSSCMSGPCLLGSLDCSTGSAQCSSTGTLPVGTSCGTSAVCAADGGCVGCTSGASCALSACAGGVTDCSQGFERCLAAGAVAAGTSCGMNAVCDGDGGCASCTEGAACDAGLSCFVGQTRCGSGAAVCAAVPASAGTRCGTSAFCNGDGGCGSCVTGAACSPTNVCLTGILTCSGGNAVCVSGVPVAPGTGCGLGLVCSGDGGCIGCQVGAACDAGPCSVASTQCATGAPVCRVQQRFDAGTSVSPGFVCDGDGGVNACDAGATCTTNPSECRQGLVACGTGASRCVDGSPKPANTPCTGSRVCDGNGACGCTPNVTCTTNPNATCFNGRTSCATGTEQCNDDTPKTGASCGASNVVLGPCTQTGSGTCSTTGTQTVTTTPRVCSSAGACGLGTAVVTSQACTFNPSGTVCNSSMMTGSCVAGAGGCPLTGTQTNTTTVSTCTSAGACVAGTPSPTTVSCSFNPVGQMCPGGTCTAGGACAASCPGVGNSCTGNSNPCTVGVIACLTPGVPTCTNGANRTLGFDCGSSSAPGTCSQSGGGCSTSGTQPLVTTPRTCNGMGTCVTGTPTSTSQACTFNPAGIDCGSSSAPGTCNQSGGGCSTSGTQPLVTTPRTCNATGTCVTGTPTSTSQACTFNPAGIDCGSSSTPGPCTQTGVGCSSSGSQVITTTTRTCNASGSCLDSSSSFSQACSFNATGLDCGSSSMTGPCTQQGTGCSTSGTRTITSTTRTCSGTTCVSTGGTSSQSCTFNPEGIGCGTSNLPGPCVPASGTCPTTGTQTTTVTVSTCNSGGSCVAGTPSTSSGPCAYDPNGLSCPGGTCNTGGSCVSSCPGAGNPCSTNSNAPCAAGVIACLTPGVPTCTNGAPAADNTDCGSTPCGGNNCTPLFAIIRRCQGGVCSATPSRCGCFIGGLGGGPGYCCEEGVCIGGGSNCP